MTRVRFSSHIGRIGVLVAGLGLLAGCAASQEELRAKARLNEAEATYSRVQTRPEVTSYAPVQLQEARNTLRAAEQAEDWDKKEHLAYMAQKQAQIAEAAAERKTAEVQMEDLSQKTSRVLMQKREQELKQAQMEADRASLLARQRAEEAERARRMAEGTGRNLETARMQAEARAREAEQAQRLAEQRQVELQQAREQALEQSRRAERAQMESQQLQNELSDLKARQSREGTVVTLGDVLFAVDRAELTPGADRSLSRLADFLKNHQERRILIEGFTDSTGTKDYNLDLSRRRAESVKDRLVSLGVEPDRISTRGYGESYPVASNDNSGGRQLNRRVEVTILQQGVQPQARVR